jgi:glyoxylase-like metal-dependent hydrolase (beta-lactamase superfamily II)
MDSARMVYGDQMDTLWGGMLPAPAGRVVALQDNEGVKLGDVEIIAWNTPGHARHHHAFVIGDVCFTGDVAGMRLENSRYLSVTAAPPQFDPVAYTQSLDRVIAANFKALYLTHFGRVDDVEWHLTNYRQRVIEVYERVAADFRAGISAEENRRRYALAEHEIAKQAGVSEELWRKGEDANVTYDVRRRRAVILRKRTMSATTAGMSSHARPLHRLRWLARPSSPPPARRDRPQSRCHRCTPVPAR